MDHERVLPSHRDEHVIGRKYLLVCDAFFSFIQIEMTETEMNQLIESAKWAGVLSDTSDQEL